MDLNQVTEKVKALSLNAGNFILNEFYHFDKSKVEYKGKNDLVSYVDKESEKLLVKGLKEILPEAAFITEEGTEKTSEAHYQWVIDPLDGTTNFTHGLPVFAVSIALLEDQEPLLGVVLELTSKDCYSAVKGRGAYCNNHPIKVSSEENLKSSILATGFPVKNFNYIEAYTLIIQHIMKSTHGLRRYGSAAVDLVWVAKGRYEGYFEYNLNAYDVAAGALIVREAGGTVTDFKGNQDFLFKKEILATGNIHNQLLECISNYWPYNQKGN